MLRSVKQELIALLIETSRHLRHFIDRKAQRQAVTDAQLRVLSRLRQREGITQSALAADLEIRPISLGRLIDKLAGRNMVQRRRDIMDRRINCLHLTRAGKHVAGGFDAFREAVAREYLDGFDDLEINATVATLFKLKMRLSEEKNGKSSEPRPHRASARAGVSRR